MSKLFDAGTKSFSSITTPGMVWIFVKSLIITIISLVLLFALLSYGSTLLAAHWSYWKYASYIPFAATFGAAFIAYLLFPGIMPLIISFFDESIIRNIETHEYPPASPPIENSFWQELPHDLKFAGKAILLNILALPFYLFPVVNFFVFISLNGYLLGNEFYLTVARRHMPYQDAMAMRRKNSHSIFLGGIALVFLSTIPVINLFAPFWGVAMMTHLYHLQKGSALK